MQQGPRYDAVVIGAGIGGLVSANYLAAAGMRVLLCDSHTRPGGYCTSFRRGGFTFDAAAHNFGGYREGALLRKVVRDLGIEDRLQVCRHDYADIVFAADGSFSFAFRSEVEATVREIRSVFPGEERVGDLFRDLLAPSLNYFSRYRSKSFRDLLDDYIEDDRLKLAISYPCFGNCAAEPQELHAFLGARVFTETLLDGGYTFAGSMQDLPDVLAQRFVDFGGDLRLGRAARRIAVEGGRVAAVQVGDDFIRTDLCVSACDARTTYMGLVGEQQLPGSFIEELQGMKATESMFICHVGLKRYRTDWPERRANLWKMRAGDFKGMFSDETLASFDGYLCHVIPERNQLTASVLTHYRNAEFWRAKREEAVSSFLSALERDFFPGLREEVLLTVSSTPMTLQRYTSNYRGSSFGWLGLKDQFLLADFKAPSFIKGLYLAGHWSTKGAGISGTAFAAHDVASVILRKHTGAGIPA